MSFAALRAPLRRAALSSTPRAPLRTSFRKFSTPPSSPAPKSSNTLLFVGVGAAALLGGGVYVYSSSDATAREANTAVKSVMQSVKSKANFTPTKEDYQKVCGSDSQLHCQLNRGQVYNKIAGILDEDSEYDGAQSDALVPYISPLSVSQTAPTLRSSSVSHGIALVPTTTPTRLVEGLSCHVLNYQSRSLHVQQLRYHALRA